MTSVVLMPSAYLPSLGGVEELTRHLALTLTAAGDAVEVWAMQSDDVDHPTTEQLDGLTVRRFPFPLPSSRPQSFAPFAGGGTKSIAALRKAVGEVRPDVLHVQCFGPNGVYATALSWLTGVPLVVTLQGETMMDDHDAFEHSTTLRVALRLGLRRAAAVTGCSLFTLRDAEARFGLAPGRGEVVFNGVSLDDAGPQVEGEPVGRPAWGRYVMAVGRVVEKKGFDLLIRAFAAIAPRHPDVTLVIGGEGSAMGALRSLSAELGVGARVRWPGRLARTAVAAAMRDADAFVMPSRLEPFGIVVLEAWRAGVPVVCTSRGGPPEFVDEGTTGLLVDPFDTAGFAASLDGLLNDPDQRARLGRGGQAKVQEFAWPAIAKQYQQIYATLPRPRQGGAVRRNRASRAP